MSIKLQPTILALGCEDNVFKTGTKWLCTIYSTIKKLRLNGKNVERGYHCLIHKSNPIQSKLSEWYFAVEIAHFLEQNEKSKV